jgi:hypothetical protein
MNEQEKILVLKLLIMMDQMIMIYRRIGEFHLLVLEKLLLQEVVESVYHHLLWMLMML